jgi:hypothetical protein
LWWCFLEALAGAAKTENAARAIINAQNLETHDVI